MKKAKLFITILSMFLSSCYHPYNNSDSERLSKLSYMELAYRTNCDSTTGTTLEERICLNLEFQKVDSILNYKFDSLLSITNDKRKVQLMTEQDKWIMERRMKSKEESEGFRGHVLGIIYLKTMIEMTEERISELSDYLIDY